MKNKASQWSDGSDCIKFYRWNPTHIIAVYKQFVPFTRRQIKISLIFEKSTISTVVTSNCSNLYKKQHLIRAPSATT